jgi:hypothetical protein
MLVLYFVLSLILVESITELLTKSEIFSPVREFFFNRRKGNKVCNFIYKLLDCGYCTSVWVSFGVYITFVFFCNKITLSLFFILILHRLSNVVHFIIDRVNGNKE